jgi:hypothetical protein
MMITCRHNSPASLNGCISAERLRISGLTILAVFLLLYIPDSTALAQIDTDSKCISTGYGVVENNFLVSIRLSSQITKNLGIEAAGEFVPSRDGQSDLYSFVQCQYHVRPEKLVVPYLGGGAGAMTLISGGDRETDFTIVFGVGGKVFVAQELAVRFDLENYTIFHESERYNRQGFSGGLLFAF